MSAQDDIDLGAEFGKFLVLVEADVGEGDHEVNLGSKNLGGLLSGRDWICPNILACFASSHLLGDHGNHYAKNANFYVVLSDDEMVLEEEGAIVFEPV